MKESFYTENKMHCWEQIEIQMDFCIGLHAVVVAGIHLDAAIGFFYNFFEEKRPCWYFF